MVDYEYYKEEAKTMTIEQRRRSCIPARAMGHTGNLCQSQNIAIRASKPA